jgi:hypothetical protein
LIGVAQIVVSYPPGARKAYSTIRKLDLDPDVPEQDPSISKEPDKDPAPVNDPVELSMKQSVKQ